MGNKIGCVGIIGGLILIAGMIVCSYLFNAWFVQTVYYFGLVPIFSQFSIFLPDLGYWVFMLMYATVIALTSFKIKDDKKNEYKFDVTSEEFTGTEKLTKYFTITAKKLGETYNANDSEELMKGLSVLFGKYIGNFFTKGICALALYIVYCICF